jgi:hypothetical protein
LLARSDFVADANEWVKDDVCSASDTVAAVTWKSKKTETHTLFAFETLMTQNVFDCTPKQT